MSRRKKRPHGLKKAGPKAVRQPTPDELEAETIQEAAHIFGCAFETASDLLSQCQNDIEDLDVSITFGGAGLEIWAAQPEAPGELVGVLRDYLEARRRHLVALEALEPRIRALVDAQVHMHITPTEPLGDIVRKHIQSPNLRG